MSYGRVGGSLGDINISNEREGGQDSYNYNDDEEFDDSEGSLVVARGVLWLTRRRDDVHGFSLA